MAPSYPSDENSDVIIPPAPAEKLTCDGWCSKKGYARKQDAKTGLVTMHPALPFVAGARAAKGWDEHYQVTEAEFDAALEEAANIKIS